MGSNGPYPWLGIALCILCILAVLAFGVWVAAFVWTP